MRNWIFAEQPDKTRPTCNSSTCMIGINYLYSFSHKLENIRK